jgi:putative hydrolase of the HAD superfamily
VVIEVVVLDVDDTLYLERDYVRSGFAAVGRYAEERLGIEGVAELAWSEFEAGRRGDIFDRVLRGIGVEPTRPIVASLVEMYREHRPVITLLPDAAALLRAVLDKCMRLAVITDGPVASQRAKVDVLGLRRLASPIVVTGELGPHAGKPSPVAFERVEQELAVRGSQLVYLADNPRKDFVAPAARGWRTVRVRRPGGLHERLPSGDDVNAELTSLDGELGAVLGEAE